MSHIIDQKIITAIKNEYKKQYIKKKPACYFYDLETISNNINTFYKYAPKMVSLYYAMKANPHKKILKKVAKNKGLKGVEIASVGELELALKYYKAENIIYTGPSKLPYELERAVKSGIKTINIESVLEAVRINNIARKLNINSVDVLVRINTDYVVTDAYEKMGGISTKMGIDQKDFVKVFKEINKLSRVNIKGIHIFSASGVLDYKSLLKAEKHIFNLVIEAEKYIKKIEIIDLGGGIGVDYTNENRVFELENFLNDLEALLNEYNFSDREIIMELGTYIVANAGYYTSIINDIKEIKDKKHILLAGGVNHMGLPLEIIPMNKKKIFENQISVENETVDVSGPLCMVSDKLSWDEFVLKAEVGDIVIYRQSGAYCAAEGLYKMSSQFIPKEIIIK